MIEPLQGFVCPTVVDLMRASKDRYVFRSRFRSMTFLPPVRTPLDQLADTHRAAPPKLGPEHTSVATLHFPVYTILTGRTASVIDWTDPKRRLPANGLKLFRARLESHWDAVDMAHGSPGHPAGPVGECFWGTGSRPAVISGGMTFEVGSYLKAHCCPRIPDIEVELGFWLIEGHPVR